MPNPEITTIKLSKKTKDRLDHLRSHKRDSYEDILKRTLDILNICLQNPDNARTRLLQIKKANKLVANNSSKQDTQHSANKK